MSMAESTGLAPAETQGGKPYPGFGPLLLWPLGLY